MSKLSICCNVPHDPQAVFEIFPNISDYSNVRNMAVHTLASSVSEAVKKIDTVPLSRGFFRPQIEILIN